MNDFLLGRLRSAETRLFAAVRDPGAASVVDSEPREWSLDALGAHRFCLVVSFRRDGRPVPTPMWFGTGDDRIYVRSAASDGKIKRLRNDPSALVAPCSFRGAPLGPPMRAIARILPDASAAAAESAISARYGLERRAYELTRARLLDPVYIELGPAGREGDDARP